MRRAPVLQSRNATSLTVQWRSWTNAPSSGMGPVVGYVLYYRCPNDTDWKHLPQTRSRMLTVSGLEASQGYEVSVSAVHHTGLIGPRSPAAETATCGSMCEITIHSACHFSFFTATCFSNVAVMGSLDVRPSVRLSVRDVGEQ